MVSQDDEDEEHSHARAGDGDEVDGDQVPEVVGEERPPGLGWRGAPLRHQSRDRPLGPVDAEREELTVDSRSAPERIGGSHAQDQGLDLGMNAWAAPAGPAGARGPVLAEAAPLPPQHGVGGHDHEGLPPPGPDPGQPDPKEPIRGAEFRARHRALVDSELLAQGQVLQSELPVAAPEEREEANQAEEGGDHHTRLSADPS
jgi:hypothetical protein